MINGLHHIALNTGNIKRLVDFYVNVVGFEIERELSWQPNPASDRAVGFSSAGKQTMLRAGNCRLEIFEYSLPPARAADPLRVCDRGYTHLCLDVSDIQREYHRLCAAGVEFICPPTQYGRSIATYGYDPDHNVIEILESVKE